MRALCSVWWCIDNLPPKPPLKKGDSYRLCAIGPLLGHRDPARCQPGTQEGRRANLLIPVCTEQGASWVDGLRREQTLTGGCDALGLGKEALGVQRVLVFPRGQHREGTPKLLMKCPDVRGPLGSAWPPGLVSGSGGLCNYRVCPTPWPTGSGVHGTLLTAGVLLWTVSGVGVQVLASAHSGVCEHTC